MRENPTGGETGENVRDNGITGGLSERGRSSAKRKGAMQIREIQDICKSREVEPHENRSGFKRDEERGGGRKQERARLFADFFIPLKIQPGILLGADLNNVVGDERMAKKARALHFPLRRLKSKT